MRNTFKKAIKQMLKSPWLEFLGEIDEREKGKFLKDAIALLMLIDWPKPFGIVMIEAMASGTPVIAWNHGSVPEIIEPGKNGYIVNSMEEALQALENIDKISRKTCREIFE